MPSKQAIDAAQRFVNQNVWVCRGLVCLEQGRRSARLPG